MTDGTQQGTVSLPLSGLVMTRPYSYTTMDDLIYFLATDGNGDLRLWVTDTISETRLVNEELLVRPGSRIFKAIQGSHAGLYLQGNLGDSGFELHRLVAPF